MSWEQRLREIMLAGGAVAMAAAACTASGTFPGTTSAGTAGASGSFPCCNANGDPCCFYRYCGGSMTEACACEMEGGTETDSLSGAICSFPNEGGIGDAGVGLSDASSDAGSLAEEAGPRDAGVSGDARDELP